jgi:hypothetical protein
VGSDHSPIILDSGEGNVAGGAHFDFEKLWFSDPDFKDKVLSNMVESFLLHEYSSALNMRQEVMANLRRFLRGYGANFRGGDLGGKKLAC